MNQWDDERNVDETFRRLFATLPVVEPSAGFVQATLDAAWQSRARRRRMFRIAAAAAALLVMTSTVLLTAFGAPQWLLLITADSAAGAVMAFVWAATGIAEAGALMVRGGTVFVRVATMPQSVAVLIASEMLGGVALYILHRLLRADIRLHSSGRLCI